MQANSASLFSLHAGVNKEWSPRVSWSLSGAGVDSPSSLAAFSCSRQRRTQNGSLTLISYTHESQTGAIEVSRRKSRDVVHGVSDTVVGVLGGGQLGRMLCQAASRLGIKVIILDPMKDCPASGLCHDLVVGSFDDSTKILEFSKRCDVLTLEIEHVDATALEKLEEQGMRCEPRASTVRIIQDKFIQKLHFSRHDVPVTESMEINDLNSAKRAGNLLGYPLMIKSRRLAYDGRGNSVAQSETDLPSSLLALGGCERRLYAEKWTPFEKEIAVTVCRSIDGSVACYPLVETVHKENICHTVRAPADVSWKVRELATGVAMKAIDSLEGAGVFAVEMFLKSDGQVLVNEVAPRPHNSGHHSIESCFTSQFEQHLRAVVGLPLGDPSMKTASAIMYNILGEHDGEAGFRSSHRLIARAMSVPGATVHWYDKQEIGRNRKMGHVTIVAPSMAVAESRLHSMLLSSEESPDGKEPAAVGIVMGSDSDLPVMKEAARVLEAFDVPTEVAVVSAHRTPELMWKYASSALERGVRVIIAGAGGAAHLPGMIAALTPLPVIGVPVSASHLGGIDSLLSIVQMPKGVPVATVAIDNAANAGLLAVRIMGLADSELLRRMEKYMEETRDEVLKKAEKLEREGWEAYIEARN